MFRYVKTLIYKFVIVLKFNLMTSLFFRHLPCSGNEIVGIRRRFDGQADLPLPQSRNHVTLH